MMTTLLKSTFETYLLDEEKEERLDECKEFTHNVQERVVFPEGFFSEL